MATDIPSRVYSYLSYPAVFTTTLTRRKRLLKMNECSLYSFIRTSKAFIDTKDFHIFDTAQIASH